MRDDDAVTALADPRLSRDHRIPDLALATPPEDLLRRPSFIVRGLHRLPVTYTRQT